MKLIKICKPRQKTTLPTTIQSSAKGASSAPQGMGCVPTQFVIVAQN